jgi:hypothetical protein
MGGGGHVAGGGVRAIPHHPITPSHMLELLMHYA